MEWKNLIITGFFLTGACCPIKIWYNTNEGFERPKKSHFKLGKEPYTLKPTDIIRADCIYQSETTIETDDRKLHITIFLRFFTNGRYIRGILRNKDPMYSYNNLERGHVGYYVIVDDEVVLEHFSVGPHDCGKYYITKLQVNEEGLGDFKKIKLDGLIGTPNW